VSRETAVGLAGRHGLGAVAVERLVRLLEGLAALPDLPTRIRDPREAGERHLADSLSALDLPAVRAARALADLGSGAGFPGLPLAIALPQARVDLVDSSRRKSEATAALAAAAGVDNARPISARVEDWARGDGARAYDVVTARALAPLPVVVEYAAPLLRAGGMLVAWRGSRDPGAERDARRAAQIVGLAPAEVLSVTPFEGARNLHLHPYEKVAPTPDGFPRRAGMAAKRPLGARPAGRASSDRAPE
jgi:16S rRNA (guanine527-N7)-methyltransferase